MTFTTLTINKTIDIDELRELLTLMENQETTDRYTNCEMEIDGNNAKINVSIDNDGNVTLL